MVALLVTSDFFLDPSFKSHPVMNPTKSVPTGGNLTLYGCSYAAFKPLSDHNVYWVHNGVRVTQTLEKYGGNETSTNGAYKVYRLGKLTIKETVFTNQGSYRCAIFIPGHMNQPIFSSAVAVQFKGE